MKENSIEIENVDIFFGKKPKRAQELARQGKNRQEILNETGNILGVTQANLEIAEGQICVLMGLSGSGKSTLLRGINRLNPISSGSIRLKHRDSMVDMATCSEERLKEVRMETVSMVFQQFGLLPWRNVRDNVGLGLELKGVNKKERRRIIDEKLAMVGLEEWATKQVGELSGGMQQRVGLARAFATDAPILLMDEPFSALDPLIRTRLQDKLLNLQTGMKKTIAFVSHDMEEALKLGNYIAIMDGGRIVQKGKAEEIILNPVNSYVADFVGHMNPLQVLKCHSVMNRNLTLKSNAIQYAGGIKISLDERGQVKAATHNSQELNLTYYSDKRPFSNEELILAPSNLGFKEAIQVRRETGRPILIVEDKKLVGVVGDKEIFASLS